MFADRHGVPLVCTVGLGYSHTGYYVDDHLTNPADTPSAVAAAGGRNRASTSMPRLLRLLPLVCLMYLTVSGGAYGVEDAVRLAGPRLTLLLCVLVPLMLSLPTAMMAAELTALIPDEGGFYL